MQGISTTKSKVFLILAIISVVLVILSIVLIVTLIPDMIEDKVDKNVQLANGTKQFDRFIELPFPIKFKVYIFNITNVDEVLNGNIPTLKEIGPYVYDQYRKKTIESYDEDEDTISYRQRETFIFNQHDSGSLSQNDRIFAYNAPLMSALQLTGIPQLIADCIRKTFPGGTTEVIIETSVHEYFFDGIDFCLNDPDMPILCALACKVAEKLKNTDISTDGLKFSLFNYKRTTDDGLYTVKRGLKDVKSLGHILRLDNSSHTSFWTTTSSDETQCDQVMGSDSTIYPPRVTKEDIFQIYATDICRYMEISYAGEGSYKNIDGYEFTTVDTLRPMTENITEDCFCSNQTLNVHGEPSCYLDGVMDLQPCIGVPVLLSFPHFLWADDAYSKPYPEGTFSPNESLHKIFLLVEPNTGTPLQGAKRMQMNAVLRNFEDVPYTQHLSSVVVPLVWIDEGVSLTDEYIDELRDMYFDKIKLANILQWTLLGVSIAASLVFGGLFTYFFCKK